MQQTLYNYTDMPDENPSPLRVGVELEWPRSADEYGPTMTQKGRGSRGLYRALSDDQGTTDLTAGGRATTDPSVGTELVSGPREGRLGGITTDEARGWYDSMLDLGRQYDYAHEPVGIMEDGSGSTAGLHIHISEWTTEQARALYEVSFEPWMQVFACSSLVEENNTLNASVFRGTRFCKNTYDMERYSVVHSVDPTAGHWEWRLPEPMGPDHFDLLMEFLERFHNDQSDAIEFAQDMVYSADERLTSIRRASAMSDGIFVPIDVSNTYILRHPVQDDDGREFYNAVQHNSTAPYIYRVDMDDESYYAFNSPELDTFHVEGFGEFSTEAVVHGEDLEPVDDSSIYDRIEAAMSEKISPQNDVETSDATDVLREVHPDLPAPESA